jgi:hypothetical protein
MRTSDKYYRHAGEVKKDTKSGNSNAIFMFPLVTVHHQIHGWHVVAKGSTFNGPPY